MAKLALSRLEVDGMGLENTDRAYLKMLINKFSGGPVGVDTMAAALSEERNTLEDVVEPYLMQQGLIKRTPRGRVAAHSAYSHLGLNLPGNQGKLLDRLFESTDDDQAQEV